MSAANTPAARTAASDAQSFADWLSDKHDQPVFVATLEPDGEAQRIHIAHAGASLLDAEALAAALIEDVRKALAAEPAPCLNCLEQLARIEAAQQALVPLDMSAPTPTKAH